MARKSYSDLALLIPYFKPYKKDIAWAILALVLTAMMVLFFGKAIKYLIDYGFAQNNITYLNLFLLVFVIAVLVMAVSGYYRSSLINAVAKNTIGDLRKDAYQNVLKISAEFFESKKTGDIISRLTADSISLYDSIANNFAFFLRNILLFFGGIVFLFLTSAKLTLVSLALIPLAIAPIFLIGKKIKILSSQAQDALANVSSHVEETINGVKTIQSFACEQNEITNFNKYLDNETCLCLTKIKARAKLIAIVIACAFGAIAVVLWIGGNDVINQKITSGDLSSFIFYSITTATALVSISQVSGYMQTASAATKRIFELINFQSAVNEIANPARLETSDSITINFKQVNFSYPSRKEFLVLNNFSLEIKAGEKIAIAGSSGGGKSTILQLLLRFYDIDSGMISLNNIDIKSLKLANLRQNFSYISQDCFIFSGTIYQNIVYANQSISKEQVYEIIDKIDAFDFIKTMPQGLDTYVGQKGIKLSGGEAQRIAIARAIIKDAPILLLDEATSALDNKNEKAIIKTIEKIAANKTVITIAHRLSSIVNSDRIIFVKDGKIVESGTHSQLMALDGFYKKMYEAQDLV